MERMWRLVIVWCSWPLLSSPDVHGAKFLGTPNQCETAEFVPGYNLAGEGLDIVKMERKGAYVVNLMDWRRENGTCILVRNKYMSNKLQKLPTAMEDWRSLAECKLKVQSKKYESSESLVNDSTSSVTNNWKIGLEVPVDPSASVGMALGGTHSRAATFAMAKSQEDKYSFTSHEINCNFYRYILASPPPLHRQFEKAIKRLPKTYSPESKSDYMELIDTYGTHYITRVQLGGRLKDITAIKTCKAAMSGLTDTAVKDCLDVEASATLVQSASLKTEFHHCQELKKKMGTTQSFSSMFNERYTEVVGGNIKGGDQLFSGSFDSGDWLESLKTMPDLVFYSAKPLFFLLSAGDPAREGLTKAIRDYVWTNALVKKCAENCQIGTKGSVRDPCACVCNSNGLITTSCCPAKPGLATLTVYRLYAKKLKGDHFSKTDGSVTVTYGTQNKRTRVIPENDNPKWPETFDFGPIEISMSAQLEFKVYDEDTRWNSELLGKCAFMLREGTVTDTCMFQYGTFFFSYKVTCAPSLGGNRCQDYISSPGSPSRAKRFHSRNGFLAGEHWEALLTRNQSKFVERDSGFEDHTGE